MLRFRALLAVIGLTVAGAAVGEPLAVDVSTGLARSTLVDGQSLPLRTLSLRAESSLLLIEARMPLCVNTTRVPTLAPDPCAGTTSGALRGLSGQEMQATFKAPVVIADGPWLDVGVRALRSVSAGVAERPAGTTAEMELVQPYGPIDLTAGLSYPIQAASARDGWRVTHAGFAWRTATGGAFEFNAERASAIQTGARDDRFTARYSYAARGNWRLTVDATRLANDPARRWQAGLNLGVAF